MKILTICPVKDPTDEKVQKMWDSFYLTRSKKNKLVFEYRGNVTQAINTAFKEHPDYDFYHITNDDVEYKTPLWDLSLAKKGKITYGDDGFQGNNLCSLPMIDGDIVRAVGWLQLPTLNRYAGDVVWKFIGDSLKILQYHPEIEITHHWEGCAEPDMNKKDMAAFAQWLPFAFKDLAKIRSVLK